MSAKCPISAHVPGPRKGVGRGGTGLLVEQSQPCRLEVSSAPPCLRLSTQQKGMSVPPQPGLTRCFPEAGDPVPTVEAHRRLVAPLLDRADTGPFRYQRTFCCPVPCGVLGRDTNTHPPHGGCQPMQASLPSPAVRYQAPSKVVGLLSKTVPHSQGV